MKNRLLLALFASSAIGLATPAFAGASIQVYSLASFQPRSLTEPSTPATSAPVSLLAPTVFCARDVPAEVCATRRAAARRAAEVIAEEHGHNVSFTQLLVPNGIIECSPPLTLQDCVTRHRLNPDIPGPGRSAQPSPNPFPSLPNPIPPPVPAPPPVPGPPPLPPIEPVPPLSLVPVPVPPQPGVILPPYTGDEEIVKRPPPDKTSRMPVIIPPANPPVVPGP